jgi:hypothetical protein
VAINKEVAMERVICCTLGSVDLAAQRRRWQALAASTRVEREELTNGLRLTFGPGAEDQLEELVAVERECCAFADWAVAGTALEITAAGDAVPVVHDMFKSLAD